MKQTLTGHTFATSLRGSFSDVGSHGHGLYVPEVGSNGHGIYVPAFSSFTQTSRHSRGSDEDLKLVSLVQAAESELKEMQTMHSKI